MTERYSARDRHTDLLQRNFKFVGIVGFVTILQSTWEGTLLTNYYGLLNTLLGGLALPQAHSERKALIQPLFTGASLASFSNTVMNTHVESMYQKLTSLSAENNSSVNLTHVLWAYTNDIMVSYILGEDLGFLKSSEDVGHQCPGPPA